jgi:hypothetical protein
MSAGIFQATIAIMRAFGKIQTHCKTCGKPETFKELNDDGSHSYLCGCGCTLYRYHDPDLNHSGGYFVKFFIPRRVYDSHYKSKNALEKIGMKKTINGKYVISGGL